MIIYCIRHGETDSNVSGIVSGRSDEGLNERGIAQAAQLNQKLKDEQFDAVYVSPMRRAIQTAEIIVPECQYIIDERLSERDLGDLKNYTISELWDNPLWNSLTEMQTKEGAETFGSGLLRVQDFLDDLKQTFSGDQKILLVTHSFISRCLWALENHITDEKEFAKFLHQNDEIKIYHLH